MATLAKALAEQEYAPPASSLRDLMKFAAHQTPARRRRIDALMLMFGIWKGRTDIPSDGLAYQEELRRQD